MKDRRRDVRIIEENKVAVSLMTARSSPACRPSTIPDARHLHGGVRLMTVAALETGPGCAWTSPWAGPAEDPGRGRGSAGPRALRREVYEVGLQFVGLDPDAEFALMDHIFGGRNGDLA